MSRFSLAANRTIPRKSREHPFRCVALRDACGFESLPSILWPVSVWEVAFFPQFTLGFPLSSSFRRLSPLSTRIPTRPSSERTSQPPVFVPSVQLSVFIYYAVWKPQKQWVTLDEGIWNSPLTYQSDKRQEAWRFISYMFVHAGWASEPSAYYRKRRQLGQTFNLCGVVLNVGAAASVLPSSSEAAGHRHRTTSIPPNTVHELNCLHICQNTENHATERHGNPGKTYQQDFKTVFVILLLFLCCLSVSSFLRLHVE